LATPRTVDDVESLQGLLTLNASSRAKAIFQEQLRKVLAKQWLVDESPSAVVHREREDSDAQKEHVGQNFRKTVQPPYPGDDVGTHAERVGHKVK
jgi:hypothetical protein